MAHVVRWYRLDLKGAQALKLPRERRFLSAATKDLYTGSGEMWGAVQLWYLIEDESPLIEVKFRAYGEDQPLKEHPDFLDHLITLQVSPSYSWTLFEAH